MFFTVAVAMGKGLLLVDGIILVPFRPFFKTEAGEAAQPRLRFCGPRLVSGHA